jgi:hypothetical protein
MSKSKFDEEFGEGLYWIMESIEKLCERIGRTMFLPVTYPIALIGRWRMRKKEIRLSEQIERLENRDQYGTPRY